MKLKNILRFVLQIPVFMPYLLFFMAFLVVYGLKYGEDELDLNYPRFRYLSEKLFNENEVFINILSLVIWMIIIFI